MSMKIIKPTGEVMRIRIRSNLKKKIKMNAPGTSNQEYKHA